MSPVTSSEIILPSSSALSKPFFSGRMPLPPGINNSYGKVHIRTRTGREYDRFAGTPALKQFKLDAENELLSARCDLLVIEAIRAARQRKEYTPLVVSVRFYFAELWRRDLDGGIKHVVDAAFHLMGLDDVLVVWLKDIVKAVNVADPHAEIDVCCLLSSEED